MSSDDRRVRRTEDALQKAMIELILERGFEAINVSEITERANVGRSTFYLHYADKEDLLQGSSESLRKYLQEQVDAANQRSESGVHPALAFCLPMLEHAFENRVLFSAMVGRRGGYFFLELVHDMWADFVRKGLSDKDEIAVQAIVGGFGATVSWWLSTAPELEPGEVDRRFRALVESSLS